MSLTDELELFIAQEVEAGRYRSASEVVREALRLLRERSEEREAKLALLRRAVREGIGQLDRGESVEPGPLFDEILEGLAEDEDAA